MADLSIIIIDDSEQKLRTYSEKFKSEGFKVLEAVNGKLGLELIKKEKPDIIFTGINMPEMNGFEMIEALKKEEALKNIPIMISSHLGREEDEERAKKLGAGDFIIYGFVSLNEIMTRARALIDGSKVSE